MASPDRLHGDVLSTLPLKRLLEQPFGTAYVYPYGSPHGVSISLPTWKSNLDYCEKSDEWRNENIEWCYPRFFVNRPIRELASAAFERLAIPNDGSKACLLFPTVAFARDCARHVTKEHPAIEVDIVHFHSPGDHDAAVTQILELAGFAMAVFPTEAKQSAMIFWIIVGGGITTRHTFFAKDHLNYLEATSSRDTMKIVPPKPVDSLPMPSWMLDIDSTMMQVRSKIAELSTPDDPSLAPITAKHVTLYPTGMSAIYHAVEAMETVTATSTVVAFGWMYDETIHNLKHGPWQKFIGYKRGTEQDLQDLTQRLKAGERVGALFCEMPSNVFTSVMPLQRLRALADESGFAIACDDTVNGFINLDLMPYVDVMLTSLTKMFSGASDVTGGSVIVNPASPRYTAIQTALQERYESGVVFPLDVQALNRNSQHVRWRAQKCNANALEVARMLHGHPLLERLNYPFFDESLPTYRSLMRKLKDGQGPNKRGNTVEAGYGPVMSIVFREAALARRFYDVLNVPKGSSFGTNFTIAVPFALLVHYYNRHRVAAYGLPEHIIRISVGLENVEEIKAAIQTALVACGKEAGQSVNRGVEPGESKL